MPSPLDDLADHDCVRCGLHETTDNVCVMGDGNPSNRIMIIGEAPGEQEAISGRVFSGRSGQLLDVKLAEAGLQRSQVYVTNVVKCRPPANDRPERGEWEACRTYLEREVKRVRPRFVLLLGNTALQAVAKKSGITRKRGVRLDIKDPLWRSRIVMATIHPAYVLRNPGQDAVLTDDIHRFAREVRGERRVTKVKPLLVNTAVGLQRLRAKLEGAEVVAYDVENRYMPWHPEWKLLCLGLSIDGETAYVVPLNHPESPFRKKWRGVLKYLEPALTRPGLKLVAQNGKWDNVQLAGGGLFLHHTFDIMLAAHLLDENRPKNLGFLSQSILGADVYKGMVETKPEKILTVPLKDLARYNGYDVGYTHQLYPHLKRELQKVPRTARLFVKLLMPASEVIQEVEAVGMWVDDKRLWVRIEKLQGMIDKEVKTLEAYHHQREGKEGDPGGEQRGVTNWNSTQQLGRWLFGGRNEGGLGLSPLETTKSGRPSTREAVLLHYHDHPAVAALLKYRTLQLKWMNTYLLPWSTRLDSRSRLHTSYKLFGTVTGRLSGDLQQVPRDPFIRSVIGAPPGWSFIVADFSQIELRIAAHIAQDKNMLRAFNTGQDLHSVTASRLTGKSISDLTSEERKKAKAVNFGFLFGMYPKKFQQYAFESYGLEVDISDAELARRQFFESYPALEKWHRRQERTVRALGYVVSPIGRIRHLPDILSSDRNVQQEAIRQAINSPVQGTASDMMLLSMIELRKQLDPQQCFMVGTLHDGIFFQCREDHVKNWVPVIKETMENLPLKSAFGCELSVPIISEVTSSQYWGEEGV